MNAGASGDAGELRQRARASAEAGRWDEAEADFRRLLQLFPEDVEALNVLGAMERARGRFREAEALLRRALDGAPDDGSVLKNLGTVLLQAGDFDAAADVLGKAVGNDPGFFVARLLLGVAHERRGESAAGLREYLASLAMAHDQGQWLDPAGTPPLLRPLVAHARRVVRNHRVTIANRVLEPLRSRHGDRALARVARCFANYLGDDPSRPASPAQRPLFLYFPGLPETPYFDRALFPWYAALEDSWRTIAEEMERALEEDLELVPFLGPPDPAGPSCLAAHGTAAARWDGLFFHRHGKRFDRSCARCPATVAALESLPLVHVPDHSPETLFSVLGPGSHILPHTGVTNTRTVTHLPLVVPRDCAISVAGQLHEWRPGRCISFDDTFEHEAWNRSDEVRVILLFDVWNPHLDEVEREAITRFVATIGDPRAMAD